MAELVELKGGLFVRADVLRLLVALEMERGVSWTVQDGRMYPDPASALMAEEAALIRADRWHALGILHYEAPRAGQDGPGTTPGKKVGPNA